MRASDPTRRRAWPRRLLLALGAAGLAALGALVWLRRPAETPFLRGLAVAERAGCFACHGAGGLGRVPDRGSDSGEVPPLAPGAWLDGYARSEDDLRHWIRFGRAPGQDPDRPPRGALAMPGYEGILSPGEIDDLTAFVRDLVRLGPEPPPEAAAGRDLARALGCFGCHGPDGRGGIENPGSFKGVIPPFEGDDFADLVRSDSELRAWIEDGGIPRLTEHPVARLFLERQAIGMPAYRDRLAPGELERLVAYIRWLRGEAGDAGSSQEEPRRADPPRTPLAERGAFVYGHAGCAICHGPAGRGGLPNPNTFGGSVPPLDAFAERVGLLTPEEVARALDAIERGLPFDAETLGLEPDCAEEFAEDYGKARALILRGHQPLRKDPGGERPIRMPGWSERMHPDGGPVSEGDVDALLVYLLRLSLEE